MNIFFTKKDDSFPLNCKETLKTNNNYYKVKG